MEIAFNLKGFDILKDLSYANRHKIASNALASTAKSLLEETRRLFASLPIKKNEKKMPTKNLGAISKIDNWINGTYKVTVSILRGRGMNRWFEVGTDMRETKSGANRGRIKPYHFFEKALKIVDVDSTLLRNIQNEFNKLVK